MRECPSCKKEVAEGLAFCPSCGKKLENTCVSCGAPMLLEDVFCGKCGKSATPPPAKDKAKLRRTLLWIAIAFSAIGILGIAGKYIYDHSGPYAIKDEVVIDNKTGLMWQRERAPNAMSHQNAINYCKRLSLGGYGDWRLPSISELKTLIVGCLSGTDACKASDNCLSPNCWSRDTCGCEANKGPGEDGDYWQKGVWQGGGTYFWSSSVLSGYSDSAWLVGFYNGDVSIFARYYSGYYVRCVRGQP